MKVVLSILGSVVLLFLVVFLGDYFSLWATGFFAPRYEQVRHDTFKNSQTYNDGMIRELYNLKIQYDQADAEGKKGIRGFALHEFSVYPIDRLPPDLQQFYAQLSR